jgi:hypothetical protein
MLAVTNTKTQNVTMVDYVLCVFIYLCWQVTGVAVTVCPGSVGQMAEAARKRGDMHEGLCIE